MFCVCLLFNPLWRDLSIKTIFGPPFSFDNTASLKSQSHEMEFSFKACNIFTSTFCMCTATVVSTLFLIANCCAISKILAGFYTTSPNYNINTETLVIIFNMFLPTSTKFGISFVVVSNTVLEFSFIQCPERPMTMLIPNLELE